MRVCIDFFQDHGYSAFCHARKLLADSEVTIKEVAASLKVNRATIYRALRLGAARHARVGQVSPR
jgi:excisionase family DNA binding protein